MNGLRSLEWRAIVFASPHKITMWVMLKVLIYDLLWLTEYHCKGVVKFNISDLFFRGQFRSVLVFSINLDLESHER